MSIGQHALSPPEAFLLLKPDLDDAREAAKIAALYLLAQRVFRMKSVEHSGFLGITRTKDVLDVGHYAGDRGGPVGAVWSKGRALQDGSTLADLAKSMQSEWGSGLKGYARDIVLPALESRGLVKGYHRKIMGVFPVHQWQRTAAGETASIEVAAAKQTARTIPDFLDNDPRQAAALILAVGSAVLLVLELRPHFAEMARVMAAQKSDGSGSSTDGSSSTGDSGSGTGEQRHEPHDDKFELGGLDAADIDALSSDLSGFDAGFDAGDSGGDGGGGDGGGGGD
jgi:hypothetical protein